MKNLPPPPVPQKLREMLKDYPQYVDELQRVLNEVVTNPSKLTPPFELAIWSLEGALESFISEARDELKAARASGNPVLIENAENKRSVMGSAYLNMGGLSDFRAYFEENRGRI